MKLYYYIIINCFSPYVMASWTAHIEGGPKRVNHAAVCIDGYIYSFGGYCTGDDFGVRQDIDIHVYNTASYKWDK
ncbi:KLHDC3 [Bugula neritina]|uniref:KLHDC3 n=1 Tax=Bugula neritina TaxID=10212 RepID=A0A7J7IWZ0_BUGNE|nr:KLHDC3 [Bugula neritina]